MRVSVNLASRPFVELRPFFLRLRLIMAALVVAGVALAITAHILSVRVAEQQAAMDRLRGQTIGVQQSKLRTEQRMRQPENARVLDRAHFLNALFLAKSFSWTAVMMDLETVLPPGVQVTSIEPGVTADGDVIIRLRVAGERARAVQLVRNLERSRRFLQPRLGSESAQAKEGAGANGARTPSGVPNAPTGPAGVEFEILANYNPLPAGEAYHEGRGQRIGEANEDRERPTPDRAGAPLAKLTPIENARKGYPRDGVVLPPYRSSTQSGSGGTLPTASPQGGAR